MGLQFPKEKNKSLPPRIKMLTITSTTTLWWKKCKVSPSFSPCIFTNHFKHISFDTNIQTIYVMSPRWDLQIVDFSFHDFHLAFQPLLTIIFLFNCISSTWAKRHSMVLAPNFWLSILHMYMGFPLTWTRGGEDKCINGGKLSEFDNSILPNYLTKLYQHNKLNIHFCNNKTIKCLYLVVFFIHVHKSVTKAKSYVVLKQSPTSILLVWKFNPGVHGNSMKTFACIIRNNCLHANSTKTLLWRSDSL